jgi:hypothetical protein
VQTRGQLPGILGGLALTLFLQVAAGVAVLIVAALAGEARPGSEAGLALVILFVAGLALWQWAYLAPAAWLARRAGFVRLRVSPSTEYVLLTAPAGNRREGPAIVKPGARVSVDAWGFGPEPTASIVRVVEDGRALP